MAIGRFTSCTRFRMNDILIGNQFCCQNQRVIKAASSYWSAHLYGHIANKWMPFTCAHYKKTQHKTKEHQLNNYHIFWWCSHLNPYPHALFFPIVSKVICLDQYIYGRAIGAFACIFIYIYIIFFLFFSTCFCFILIWYGFWCVFVNIYLYTDG